MKRFFIVGNPRSGTTLLRLMLNKHNKLSVPPEAGFLVWLYDDYKKFTLNENNIDKFIESLRRTKKIEYWNLDFNKLKKFIFTEKPKSFSKLMDSVYAFYTRYNLEKHVCVYGDKNNFYLNKIDLLAKLYNDTKFVHIIRDGRSVAVSYKELNKQNFASKYAPDLPESIENIANEWVTNIERINQSFEKLNLEQHYTVRFEDLISNPEDSLTNICRFLGVEYADDMLNYFQSTEKEGLEPEKTFQWKAKNKMPLQKDEAFKYKKLSKQDLSVFEVLAKEILSQYEYV